MLVAKVYLHPYGREEDATELYRLVVINDGTGDEDHGNYVASLYSTSGDGSEEIGRATVQGWPRELPAWRLIDNALWSIHSVAERG